MSVEPWRERDSSWTKGQTRERPRKKASHSRREANNGKGAFRQYAHTPCAGKSFNWRKRLSNGTNRPKVLCSLANLQLPTTFGILRCRSAVIPGLSTPANRPWDDERGITILKCCVTKTQLPVGKFQHCFSHNPTGNTVGYRKYGLVWSWIRN